MARDNTFMGRDPKSSPFLLLIHPYSPLPAQRSYADVFHACYLHCCKTYSHFTHVDSETNEWP